MADILDLLRGSDDPGTDQRMFTKSQIVFWLLGATDGHAKNFSIFLKSGGRFRMTPLYDVVSAQPSVDADQLRENRFKLALAVGDNRHYVINTILKEDPHTGIRPASSCCTRRWACVASDRREGPRAATREGWWSRGESNP